jgi:ABC-2 type transport system permease protein
MHAWIEPLARRLRPWHAPGRLAPVLAVARHEWRSRINAPLTYVYLAGFLAALSTAIFLVADLYGTDEASPRLLLVFLPWVALILVPALTMKAWNDEVGDRSLELMQSLPVGLGAIVGGKFLAGAGVLLVALAGTLPFAATLFYLGAPDPWVMLAAYLGAALLLLAFLAVGLLASSLAREPVAALVLGVLALLVLILLGMGLPSAFAPGARTLALLDGLREATPKIWLDRIGTGRIELAGVLAFALIIAASLLGAGRIIEARRIERPLLATFGRRTLWALAGVAAIAIATAGARGIPLAIDLTAAREHTLGSSTIEVARRLPHGTVATLYWSRSDASVPAGIRSQAARVEELLTSLAARSQGRMRFVAKDPAPDTDAELEASGVGIRRVPLSAGGAFYFGATIAHGDRTARIAYFDPRRDGLAEYDVARAMSGLARKRTPKIGILSPHVAPSHLESGREGLSILADLKRAFDVAVVPHFSAELPEGLDVLVLIDATILRREMLYAIDQHVMRGGGLIVLIDPRLQIAAGSERPTPEPSEDVNDISDLLLRWGVRYRSGEVVGDDTFSAPVMDSRRQQLLFPFWMRMREEGLAGAHPVTAAINELLLVEAGSFEITAAERVTALVSTTRRSGVLAQSSFAAQSPEQLTAALKGDGRARAAAVHIRGPLASAFAGPLDGTSGPRHVARSTGAPSVFAIADADWLFDSFSVEVQMAGGGAASRPLNDNWALFLNMVDYAGGEPALIGIRSRGRLSRPFTRVEALLREGQQRYRAEEAEVAAIIGRVDQQIARIVETAGVQRIEQLPDAIQARLQQLQKDLAPQRKRLRDLRLRMREDVDRLGIRLTALNLLSGPVLAALLWLLVRQMRQRRLISINQSSVGR